MKLNHNKKYVKISLNLFALYAVLVCGSVFALPAFAASDPLAVVENLSTFIFSLIRAVGLILLGWGIVQVGLSWQSHDPSQRSQGCLLYTSLRTEVKHYIEVSVSHATLSGMFWA